jgi:hypothetical protein
LATGRILAEAPAWGRRPVVFLLSTYEAADYVAQAAVCGAVAYLPKGALPRCAPPGPRRTRPAGWPEAPPRSAGLNERQHAIHSRGGSSK